MATTTTFAIGGMHCAACAVRNERTLRKIPGVLEANVNLGTRRARIAFDETAVTEAALEFHVVFDLVERHMAGALDHDLATLGPGALGELGEGLKLAKLGFIGRIRKPARAQAVAE